MITTQDVLNAYSAMKSDNDFPLLVAELKKLNVTHFNFYVNDGHEVFYTSENQVELPSKYPLMEISNVSNAENLYQAIKIHQKKETDFPTFLKQSSEYGVSYWSVDFKQGVCIYFNLKNEEILREPLP